ncbi:MLO-like protein 1 [Sorghum bicolor]|uniref:MLO-like protein 1 n=1 Tax=Sorghum bicolor TaxID=4558 RepID=UPI000B42384C|nr:MLO-like protein 1 [Sorghum bicolor]|eukprot:XP_021319271.1 MLO-like protein 1 [Sorghum bicolor]
MLLRFVSLLLVVFQVPGRDPGHLHRREPHGALAPVPGHLVGGGYNGEFPVGGYCSSAPNPSSRGIFSIFGRDGAGATRRRMLQGRLASEHCSNKGQVPLLSLPSLEQIHVFIFVLAITHVVLSAITVLLGLLQRSFFKQFYGLLTQDDYDAMRLGFFLVNHGDDDTWLHAVDFFARQLYRRQYFRKSGRRHFVPCCSP